MFPFVASSVCDRWQLCQLHVALERAAVLTPILNLERRERLGKMCRHQAIGTRHCLHQHLHLHEAEAGSPLVQQKPPPPRPRAAREHKEPVESCRAQGHKAKKTAEDPAQGPSRPHTEAQLRLPHRNWRADPEHRCTRRTIKQRRAGDSSIGGLDKPLRRDSSCKGQPENRLVIDEPEGHWNSQEQVPGMPGRLRDLRQNKPLRHPEACKLQVYPNCTSSLLETPGISWRVWHRHLKIGVDENKTRRQGCGPARDTHVGDGLRAPAGRQEMQGSP
mmetsp:Transcript_62981/g.178956  ORF Transcript_62981/g.178956 Transcript_62981/m.178956 type:complete len:275 (+) Transcript_62981:556-1380(+)